MKSISTENTITHTFMIKGGIMNFIISCMAISVKAALGGFFLVTIICILFIIAVPIVSSFYMIYNYIKRLWLYFKALVQ